MLKHIHVTESHRGMLGEGTVSWEEFFSALKKIDFEGTWFSKTSVPQFRNAGKGFTMAKITL
jgi:sugar phosphate isomerase/epimerase